MQHNIVDREKHYRYVYLLSDDTSEIIRFKSDNCSTQYKCKWIFKQWQSIAVQKGKRVIVYYGAPGHGKGLVDVMNAFDVKGSLRKQSLLHQCSRDL